MDVTHRIRNKQQAAREPFNSLPTAEPESDIYTRGYNREAFRVHKERKCAGPAESASGYLESQREKMQRRGEGLLDFSVLWLLFKRGDLEDQKCFNSFFKAERAL
ncbi:hypothetical protein JTB14_037507 [Gonioctena quinquepunctata]|nr:hypothetical protein JTB14_037507 [Gonioctena quinquepunctata]